MDESPGFNHTYIAAAGRSWDAVRVSRFLGLRALRLIEGREGPVVVDPASRLMYFLVRPGSARTWRVPQSRALGEQSYVVLPQWGKNRPPGPYWLTAACGRQHTDIGVLRSALMNAQGLKGPEKAVVNLDVDRLSLDQMRGWNCALCGKRLMSDRPLGTFTGRSVLTSEPTELWACAPKCR
ncbi:hypothetical protein ABT282_34090 [Streptomyces sp. NPDC000927]|uniref:hypothetical protein n=1 Tax=Streptomyces sp. NPDC000927 TaxID=3154371 RepID=UPI00331CA9F4